MVDPKDSADGGHIAIIGMSGRFPGAPDIEAFWRNLRDGVESVRFFTDAELRKAGVPQETLDDPAYVKAWPQLADIDTFDAGFFGLSPRDAAIFDPQHRLFLEVAWEAFERAGYVGEQVPGPVGVFAASGQSEYLIYNVLPNRGVLDSVGEWLARHLGNDTNFLATRVSYQLNLTGPSLSVQTACSSSLVAVHLAAQSLLNGECDLALAGGSTISAQQHHGYLYKEGEILSPDGHCRAFDAQSAGTTIGSASACVLLKRLSDALDDGDTVLAVLRGSAINNDGAQKVGYLAPSVEGQAKVVAEALAVSGLTPDDISYVETHGTGTLLGDPIEVTGLTQAFRLGTQRKQFCAIGSLKPNVGHAGEAAGVSSLIKVVLALQHRQLPPSLFFHTPNPRADFADSPFFVNASLREWTSKGPRRAGVTGLGAGGTNAHLVLEEAPAQAPSPPSTGQHLLTLSAKTPAALEAATARLAAHLEEHPAANLADVAFTLQRGRTAFAHRKAVVASTTAQAVQALRGAAATGHAKGRSSLVFMFPGGGAQYAGMGQELYETLPVYRRTLDACATWLLPKLGEDLRRLMFPAAANAAAADATLQSPIFALPALFATQYALAQQLAAWKVTPDAMVGHSAGEYLAAVLAGVLRWEDGLALVTLRGQLFASLPAGGMLSVPLSEREARAALTPGLSLAAANAPGLSVVSGPVAELAALEATLKAREVESTRIHINVAAHSSMLEPILAPFEAFCRTVRFGAPRVPYVSNLTGDWVTAAQVADPTYWVQHLRQTVRFEAGMRTLMREGSRVFLEVGPGRTLSSLARQQGAPVAGAAPTLRHPKEEGSDVAFLLLALGRAWAAGAELDFEALHGGTARRRVRLPTYPFERQRYWVEADATPARAPARAGKKRADVASWFSTPTWSRAPLSRAEATASGGAASGGAASGGAASSGAANSASGRGASAGSASAGSASASGASAGSASTSGASATSSGAAGTGATAARWLVLVDDTGLGERLVPKLTGTRVVTVEAGEAFARIRPGHYSVRPAVADDFTRLVSELASQGNLPTHVLHLWTVSAPASAWARLLARPTLEDQLARAYFSQLFLAQALVGEVEALQWNVVSTGLQQVAGELVPEAWKATLLGPSRVLPREFPQVKARSIDVPALASGGWAFDTLLGQLQRELEVPIEHSVVAWRGAERWVQTLEPTPLPVATERRWLKHGSVVLISGGLGGLGLTVAEHCARHARAKLVLLGRSALPEPSAWDTWLRSHDSDDVTSRRLAQLKALEALGAEVVLEAADVTDGAAMRAVVARARKRFGRVDVVVHAAGVLRDTLIAMHDTQAQSEVLDAKVRGALALDAAIGDSPLDAFILFSSVSAVLGLPGQVDYTAANAFLDAFAQERSARRPGRTLSINWNAWQEVGMVAELARAERAKEQRRDAGASTANGAVAAGTSAAGTSAAATSAAGTRAGETPAPSDHHPFLEERTTDTADTLAFSTVFRSGRHWLTDEHVVRGAQAVIPGTGYLELARAVAAQRPAPGALQLRDVIFLSPFIVPAEAPRTLHLRLRGDALTFFSEDVSAPHATARVGHVATPRPAPLELAALTARCTQSESFATGFATQAFMDFGPRWGNLTRIRWGDGEALLELSLPSAFADEVATFGLHPALLDTATGGAQRLVPGFDAARDFFVPFSYGTVTLFAPLTPTLVSHVRLLPGGSQGTAVFDVTLADATGAVLARLEGFTMRRTQGLATRAPAPFEAARSQGILPAEGMDALDRLLAHAASPQMLASSVDVVAWAQSLTTATPTGAPQFARPTLSSTFAAPRTTLEKELATLWSELLGVAQVGIHDDFFELGGQSLVAVRLFNRIRRAFGVELQLAALFEAPTIAQGAALLQARLGTAPVPLEGAAAPAARGPSAPGPARKHLVAVQKGSGAGPALYVVHGAGGNVLNFRDIARALGPEQAFFGLQARGVDGLEPPHESIDAMAQAYLAEVRAAQPHGPYLLGGYSGGGLVAFELARHLTALGEQVGPLVLIDTFYPGMRQRSRSLSARLQRYRELGLQASLQGGLATRRRAREGRQERTLLEAALARGGPVPFELRDAQLTWNFERAAAAYQPAPWPGRAVLFRAQQLQAVWEPPPEDYGWSAVITGGVQVVQVPGNHDTLLLGSNAAVMLGALRAVLQGARSEGAS